MNSVFILKARFLTDSGHATNKLKYISSREGVVLDESEDIQLLRSPDGVYLKRKEDNRGFEIKGELTNIESIEELFDRDEHLYGKIVDDVKKYVSYHAQRPGSKGLFNSESLEVDVEEEREQLYEHLNKYNSVVWDWVLSLREDDHNKLKMSKKRWQEVLKKVMPKVKQQLGINLHWYAAHHYKEGHPHIHLMFYDKDNRVHRGKLDKSTFLKIKSAFVKEIMYEEKKLIYQDKKQAEDKLLETAMGKVTSYDKNQLKRLLTNSNTFRYKYLNSYIKSKLDSRLNKLLEEPEVKLLIDEYNKQQLKLINIYDRNEDSVEIKLKKNFEEKIMNKLRNKILKEIKEEIGVEDQRVGNSNDYYSNNYLILNNAHEYTDKCYRNLLKKCNNQNDTNKSYYTQRKKLETKYKETKKKNIGINSIASMINGSSNTGVKGNKADVEREKEIKKIKQLQQQEWEAYL